MEARRRIARDLLRLRDVDAYVVAGVATVLAVLTLVGVGSDDLRWSVALAALAVLVHRLTLPDARPDADAVLLSRVAFDDTTLVSRLREARSVWVFGPSVISLLGGSTAAELRRTVLARADGLVRVAVLDPTAAEAVALASRQLDDGLDFTTTRRLPEALEDTVALLDTIAGWPTPGRFEHRLVGFNPGFSVVAFDPEERHGLLIVEFHGFHNESVESRMHVELTRRTSDRWYDYWLDQFTTLWATARPPCGPGPATGSASAADGADDPDPDRRA